MLQATRNRQDPSDERYSANVCAAKSGLIVPQADAGLLMPDSLAF
jgi:hypothetical protein